MATSDDSTRYRRRKRFGFENFSFDADGEELRRWLWRNGYLENPKATKAEVREALTELFLDVA